MSFNKILLIGCIGLALVIGIPLFLSAGDPPHNDASGVSCADCHGQALLNNQSPFYTDNTSDTAYNAICLTRCHTMDSMPPYNYTNAPPVISHAPGGTAIKCTTCHHNHDQDQLYTGKNSKNSFFVAMGMLDTGAPMPLDYNSGNDTTTITYATLAATDGGSKWTDLNLLAEKTDTGRGAMLVPNHTSRKRWPVHMVKSINTGAKTITVKGNVQAAANLGIFFGQVIRRSINYTPVAGMPKPVAFYGPETTQSFAKDESGTGTDTSVTGICQVCHTQTKHWLNDGTAADHYSGQNCMGCHAHAVGFEHGGGAGGGGSCGSMNCHGGTGSHPAHVYDDLYDCSECHDTDNYPRFKSGTDLNGDGIELSETDVCDSCHSSKPTWVGGSACLTCHDSSQGNRVDVEVQLNGNSHHIQDITPTDSHCYECHWEAASDGRINNDYEGGTVYHGGARTSGSAVNLVIYGSAIRPTNYQIGSTALNYSADGSRVQIEGLNTHCLGCHSDQNNGVDVFGDGKSPNHYAWDVPTKTSIGARYSQGGTTSWDKYGSTGKNAQTKAYSAHGNASTNERGWDTGANTWITKTSAPGTFSHGASLVFDGGDYIYATRGTSSTTFYRYSISGNSWATMAPVPNALSFGADLAYDGGDYIYTAQGNNMNVFYRYSISGNSWTTMTPAPGLIYLGSAATHDGGNYIYVTGGGGTTAFYRYSISGNSWTTMTVLPGSVRWGGDLAFDGGNYIYATAGNNTTVFYRYSISSNSWVGLPAVPDTVYIGGALAYDGVDFIYAIRGYLSGALYSYSISNNTWAKVLPDAPVTFYSGADLVDDGGDYIYVIKGNSSATFYRYTKGAEWPDTSGTAAVVCFDCHNSHGSTVSGTTTRYTSATTNGGILKDTVNGIGGYSVTYQPAAGGTGGNQNQHNPGAALCFDCHLNADGVLAGKPWGYQATYEATQAIHGYFDTPYFGPGTFGSQQKYPYKGGTSHQGGHFGVSSSMNTTPINTIGGLCTPCHDPHGVSPTLGANQQYAVPILKGTWMTSPYREDAAPPTTNEKRGPQNALHNPAFYSCSGVCDYGWAGGSDPGYNIDQNTFSEWDWTSTSRVSQSVSQFGGLCTQCHTKSGAQGIDPDGTSAWKSMDRVHETVKGWGANNKHSYTCSKCHSPHASRLPRLMVTNCLDYKHRGRVASGGSPGVNTGEGFVSTSKRGSGRGRFPAGGGTVSSVGSNRWDVTYGFGYQTCHGGSWPSGELWNTKTPW